MSRIQVCLVRYGQLGRIGWFGTVHQIPIQRGDQVVVLSVEGTWIGDVLRINKDSETESHSGSTGVARGELLRVASADDLTQQEECRKQLPEIIRFASQRLNEVSAGVSLLDVDLSLDQRTIVLQFAGPSEVKLGPLADEIAGQFEVERAQWLGLEMSSPVMPETEAPSDLPGQGICESMRRVASGSLSGLELKRFANRHRHELGIAGLYFQKLRGLKKPDSNVSTDSTESMRRWMVRLKSTAGQMTVGQFRGLAQFSRDFGNGTLRLTSRQGIQYHGVAEGHVVDLLDSVSNLAMTARGSCGNTLRNVTCCPLQPRSTVEKAARQLASQLAQLWLPSADWLDIEAWLPSSDGEPQSSINSTTDRYFEADQDRAYPDGYLPHKWKIGVATEDHNCVNVRANDLGIVLRRASGDSSVHPYEKSHVSGLVADLWIGGGLSYKRSSDSGALVSLPMLAQPLGTVRLEDVEPIVRTLMQMHRQFVSEQPAGSGLCLKRGLTLSGKAGNPGKNDLPPKGQTPFQTEPGTRRSHKRFKYFVGHFGTPSIATKLVDMTGIEWVRPEADREDRSVRVRELDHHALFEESDDGRWQIVSRVRGGRLRFEDRGWRCWQEVLSLCRSVCVGPRHTLVLGGVEASDRTRILDLMQHGLADQFALNEKEVSVLTCVALPTCPLAVEDAERTESAWRKAVADAHPSIKRLLGALNQLDGPGKRLDRGELRVAVSGCTNGCSLPILADVGLVEESAGNFRLFLGGGGNGLGVPLAVISGPDQLVSVCTQLCKEMVEAQRQGASMEKWFAQKSESRNFAWPQRENRLS